MRSAVRVRAPRPETSCCFGLAHDAGVTQLVEFLPSKQAVAGSSPVSRDLLPTRRRDILPPAPNAARLPPGAKEAVKEAITHERERVEEIVSTAGIWKGHAQTPQARRREPRRRPARQARRAGPSARAAGH